jgi:CelD/BcsL family acetyltransferase involved in cellulose biosynthesis
MEVWWREFSPKAELFLGVVRENSDIIGIAPLQVKERRAFLIGSADVCDYLDFVVALGKERRFFNALLDNLRKEGIEYLDLETLRPDSAALTHLVGMAQERKYEVSCQQIGVSVELALPSTWEGYLGMLTGKQRREIRRKLRRLTEMGGTAYRVIQDRAAVRETMDTFLRLFIQSRQEKAAFMTEQMESFFKAVTEKMAEAGLLRLGVLELGVVPVAMVMCFDYNDCLYLYNSGYDPQYRSLSAGLLSKVLSIKDSIERGRKKFDFLKGAEAYKYQLGGGEIPLYSCQIIIK